MGLYLDHTHAYLVNLSEKVLQAGSHMIALCSGCFYASPAGWLVFCCFLVCLFFSDWKLRRNPVRRNLEEVIFLDSVRSGASRSHPCTAQCSQPVNQRAIDKPSMAPIPKTNAR